MTPTYVVSSTINAIGYSLGKLFVRFKSGTSYSYDNVPYDIYDALKKAESCGQFLHRAVKGKFKYTRLSNDPFVTS